METPAGWYDDGSGRQRWWDGQQWTDHFADTQVPPPGAPSTVPAQVAPQYGVAPVPQFGAAVPEAQAKGWAIAALVVGIVAFLTGLLPVFGILVGIAGVALGVVALVKKQPKGLAITAIVLAGIAVLVSTGTTIGLATLGSQPLSTSSSSSPATEPSEPAAAPEPAAPEKPAESKPAPDAGTAENPLPQPYTAKGFLGGDKYSLAAKIFNASASEQVLEWNQFNQQAPAGFKYVVAEMTMTGIDEHGVEPALATFDLTLATAEGNKYTSEFVIFGDGMPRMEDGPKLYPGSTFTGYAAYIVPEAATSFLLHDNGSYIAIS